MTDFRKIAEKLATRRGATSAAERAPKIGWLGKLSQDPDAAIYFVLAGIGALVIAIIAILFTAMR